MPNWCENTLLVQGDKKSLSRFEKAVKTSKSKLSFQKTIPLPLELKDTVSPSRKINKTLLKKFGADNWYDWQVNNWGTKWDVSDVKLVKSKKGLRYYFLSAWSPPVRWLEKIAKKYPELYFELKYNEDGMGFAGVASGDSGIIEDNSY